MSEPRAWKKEGDRHWRCDPWTICLCFIDGCSLYVLSKDGEEQATAYKEDLEDAIQAARDAERGA